MKRAKGMQIEIRMPSTTVIIIYSDSSNCPDADQTDECADSPCQNSGRCVNEGSTYRCECGAGWTGSNCETEIQLQSPGKNAYEETSIRRRFTWSLRSCFAIAPVIHDLALRL